MRNCLISALFLVAGALHGQQVVAPTPQPVGPPRGDNTAGYNVVNSFETGYRFRSVGGDLSKYSSDVNYGNGLRLLGSKLTVHSRDGHGSWFDELTLTTQGLGNDPYQSSVLRVQKNKLYRYDFLWRLNDYLNPGLDLAGGGHLMNTQRRLQDHDLTLFPQSRVKLFLGYSRNSHDGPALTSQQVFDSRSDEFPLFSSVRRVQNDYRLGGEISLAGFRFNVLHGWEDFKDDTQVSLPQPSQGNNPGDNVTLSQLRKSEPYHGTTPYWRLNLFTERSLFSVNGRFTYAEGRRNFIFDENALGTDRFATGRDRQLLVLGNGRRPVSSGSLTLSFFPAPRLTIANHTSFHSTRMEGDSTYREFNNSTLRLDLLVFEFLGVRAISNSTDATFRASNRIGLYGGYHVSTRRIRSIEQITAKPTPAGLPIEQENRLNAGIAGIRLQPFSPLSISLEAEVGRADRPFFPISDRNYHALNGRLRYKAKSFTLSGAARTFYNTNSVSLSVHSSRSRTYSLDASWTPRDWFAIDAGYSKLHLDTLSGIVYFASGQLAGGNSLYVSNLHAGNLGARFALRKRADLYVGYSHVQDAGDGRASSLAGPSAAAPAFTAAQTFPVAYRTPLARFSVKLHERLRWNVGYQFYSYGEDFSVIRNYRAHTGYSSVLWSF